MGNQSNAVAGAVADANPVLQIREDWRLAREAHKELQIVGMPRVNLLLVGTASVNRIVLEMLGLEWRKPIVTWRPGQRLELPPPGRAATLVLHEVSQLTDDEQTSVLRWLDQTAGRIQVVSTTAEPLSPRVKTGAFNDVLYYRLNAVCVDVASATH